MKAHQLTARHELKMPDGTWCRVEGVRRYGRDLLPAGFSWRREDADVEAREVERCHAAQGWSQGEVAEACELSTSSVSRIEAGSYFPTSRAPEATSASTSSDGVGEG